MFNFRKDLLSFCCNVLRFFKFTFFCRFPDFGETVKAVFFLADLFRQGPTGRLGRFLSAKCRLFLVKIEILINIFNFNIATVQCCGSMTFLVWIRIRIRIQIRGSMPLTKGSGFGSGSGSFYFHH
jgi:hypothetical protein